MVTIKVSPLLRRYTSDKESVKVKGNSPMECLHALEAKYPDLKRLLYELNNTLKDGDELLISVAIGGA